MNAQFHKPAWQCIEFWLIRAVVLAAVFVVFAPRASGSDRVVTANEIAMRLPAPEPTVGTNGLPFTAWDVVQYFSTVLEMSAEKGTGGSMVFENQQASFPEDRWRIAISIESKSVVVEFVIGGDYGMSLAREFFESPLFERSESEQLYEMLSHAQNSPVKKLPRFTVGMLYKETAELQNLVLRFAAPGAT